MSVGAAGPLVVTYPLSERSRAIVAEELGGAAAAVYLADLAPPEQAAALRGAGALLAHDTSKELAPADFQFFSVSCIWMAENISETAMDAKIVNPLHTTKIVGSYLRHHIVGASQ